MLLLLLFHLFGMKSIVRLRMRSSLIRPKLKMKNGVAVQQGQSSRNHRFSLARYLRT